MKIFFYIDPPYYYTLIKIFERERAKERDELYIEGKIPMSFYITNWNIFTLILKYICRIKREAYSMWW